MAIAKLKQLNPSQEHMMHSQFRPKTGTYHIVPICHTDEQWLPITSVNNIQDWYYISSYGRVYSKLYDCLIRPRFIGRGYLVVTLRTKDNRATDHLIHRLVMMEFQPIPNPEDFQVNHKDTIKTTNRLYNLEWSTCSENMIHAYKHGLYPIGQDNNFATITNEQATKICIALENKYLIDDVCNFAGLPINDKSKALIYQIKAGNNWKQVYEKVRNSQ